MITKSIFIFMLVLVLTAILIGEASAKLAYSRNIDGKQEPVYRILPVGQFTVYKIEPSTNLFRDSFPFFDFPFIS